MPRPLLELLKKLWNIERENLPLANTLLTALFVILPNIVSQSSWMQKSIQEYDTAVTAHFNEIFSKEILRSDYLLNGVHHAARVNQFEEEEALVAIGTKLDLKTSISQDAFVEADERERALFARYESGAITNQNYLNELANLNRQDAKKYQDLVKKLGAEIRVLRENPPQKPRNVDGIKNLLVTLQLIGALFLIGANSKFMKNRQS